MIEEVTSQFLEHLQTSEGGYTQRAFALLGVDKPQGEWQPEILGKLISCSADEFERARYGETEWKEMIAQLESAGIYDLSNRVIVISRSQASHPRRKKRVQKFITNADGVRV